MWGSSVCLAYFSKARAFLGGVNLTSPIVREYIANYARAFIYSTSLPHAALIGLRTSFDYIKSEAGAKLRFNAKYLLTRLTMAFAHIPQDILALTPSNREEYDEPHIALPEDVVSPIIPVYTAYPLELQAYLQGSLEYRVWAIAFLGVPRSQGRVRVIVHAGNSLEELDSFVLQLVAWSDNMAAKPQAKGGAMTRARL